MIIAFVLICFFIVFFVFLLFLFLCNKCDAIRIGGCESITLLVVFMTLSSSFSFLIIAIGTDTVFQAILISTVA